MPNIPLAERLRPKTIDEYIGQEHLVGRNGVFRKFFETGNVPSFILWGVGFPLTVFLFGGDFSFLWGNL